WRHRPTVRSRPAGPCWSARPWAGRPRRPGPDCRAPPADHWWRRLRSRLVRAKRRPRCIPPMQPQPGTLPRTMLASPRRRYGDHLRRCRIQAAFTLLRVFVIFVVLAAQLLLAAAQVGLPLVEQFLVVAPAPAGPAQEFRV